MNGKHINLILTDETCTTCQKPMNFAYTSCGMCGKPLHLVYPCGSWLLDSRHPEAEADNDFWCAGCLQEQYGVENEG